MCLDDKTGDIYLMGRYVDPISADLPGAAEIGMMTDQGFIAGEEPNDLWVYHTRGLKKGHWSRLDSDVHSHGGPRLTHDSAMVFDPYCRNIWVFGGRHNADAQLNEDTWSGLYTYHVDSQTWTAETYTSLLKSCGEADTSWSGRKDPMISIGLQDTATQCSSIGLGETAISGFSVDDGEVNFSTTYGRYSQIQERL